MATTDAATSGRLFSNALASMANVVAGSLLVFALYRVLLVRLGPETLGIWSLLIASVSAARLSEMGMAGAATRFIAVARAREDHEHAVQIAQTATSTLLVFGLAGALLAQLLLPLLLARFLHGAQLQIALQALPFALVAFAVGLAGSAVQSALDGCQRVDLRVGVSLVGQVVLLIATMLLARPFGLAGVAIAQIAQAVVILLGSWLVLRGQLRGLPLLPARWSLATFRQILGYSALFQLNNLLLMLLDPLVKFLLARFGGLTATAYFDMANQMVQRLRQLPVAAAQVLVPAMAQAGTAGVAQLQELYGRSYRAIFAIAVPLFCAAALLVPTICRLWVGHEEPLFTGMMWICLAGWALSTAGTPAYYGNVGIGALSNNAIGHTLTNACAFLLGWLGGTQFGAFGVCAGYSLGIAAGGLFVQASFMHRLGLEWRTAVPEESRWLLVLSLVAVLPSLLIDEAMRGLQWSGVSELLRNLLHGALLILLFLVVAGAVIWRHPLRRSLSHRVQHAIRPPADPS